jgi:hypothetical protein
MSLVLWRVAGALALVLLGTNGTWQVQSWRYSAQLAEQSRLQTDTLNQLAIVGNRPSSRSAARSNTVWRPATNSTTRL